LVKTHQNGEQPEDAPKGLATELFVGEEDEDHSEVDGQGERLVEVEQQQNPNWHCHFR